MSKQIRPTRRFKGKDGASGTSSSNQQRAQISSPAVNTIVKDSETIERTRQQMERWMGLNEGDCRPDGSHEMVQQSQKWNANDATEEVLKQESKSLEAPITRHIEKPTKSILRTPKYTNSVKESLEAVASETESLSGSQNIICKNVIVERDPRKPMLKRNVNLPPQDVHNAVEGFVPAETTSDKFSPLHKPRMTQAGVQFDSPSEQTADRSTSQKEESLSIENGKDEPLILNSFEEMFEAAGQLPTNQDHHVITPDTKLLEADLAFSVMTQENYDGKLSELKEQQEEERQAQLKVFLGTENIFGDESDDEEITSDSHSGSDSDDEELMEMLMSENSDGDNDDFYHDQEDVEEDLQRQPRVFRLLWDTLMEWITPESVRYTSYLARTLAMDNGDDGVSVEQWKSPVMERSDIEASRCAGLMAMVKLYLPKSLQELGLSPDLRRTADVRLGELLRSFSYVLDAPKLPVKLWRAMTCILLETVLVEQHDSTIVSRPLSVANVGLTMDEYRYLSREAFKAFGQLNS